MKKNSGIDVIKYDTNQIERWRYRGKVIRHTPDFLILEAFFDRSDIDMCGLLLARGDLFLELYFVNRWYNIFEIYSGKNQNLKGWYCNITTPASIAIGQVSYIDLALDLLVFPDGRQIVLDKDEFDGLNLEEGTRRTAIAALNELQMLFREKPSFQVLEWI